MQVALQFDRISLSHVNARYCQICDFAFHQKQLETFTVLKLKNAKAKFLNLKARNEKSRDGLLAKCLFYTVK